jgi:hypothetical protein
VRSFARRATCRGVRCDRSRSPDGTRALVEAASRGSRPSPIWVQRVDDGPHRDGGSARDRRLGPGRRRGGGSGRRRTMAPHHLRPPDPGSGRGADVERARRGPTLEPATDRAEHGAIRRARRTPGVQLGLVRLRAVGLVRRPAADPGRARFQDVFGPRNWRLRPLGAGWRPRTTVSSLPGHIGLGNSQRPPPNGRRPRALVRRAVLLGRKVHQPEGRILRVAVVTMKQLLEAGVHFGHQTRAGTRR